MLDLPNPIVTMYHNVTPEQYFEDLVPAVQPARAASSSGYLARRSLFGVADSNYNRREMLAAGFRRVEVLPVRVDFPSSSRGSPPTGAHRATGCSSDA